MFTNEFVVKCYQCTNVFLVFNLLFIQLLNYIIQEMTIFIEKKKTVLAMNLIVVLIDLSKLAYYHNAS